MVNFQNGIEIDQESSYSFYILESDVKRDQFGLAVAPLPSLATAPSSSLGNSHPVPPPSTSTLFPFHSSGSEAVTLSDGKRVFVAYISASNEFDLIRCTIGGIFISLIELSRLISDDLLIGSLIVENELKVPIGLLVSTCQQLLRLSVRPASRSEYLLTSEEIGAVLHYKLADPTSVGTLSWYPLSVSRAIPH